MSIIRTAPAPTRATSSVVLSAGLINIPLSVYTAVEPTAVVRKEFLGGNADIPVGRAPIRKDTQAIVDQSDVTRMALAANGAWVTLTDDEVGVCAGTSGGCEVVTFVPIKDTGHYLTDGLYQVRPKVDKRGGAAATAAFSLLLAGMKARKVHALVKIVMRGAPRYALLTVDGDLLMIATADAVREPLPMPDVKPGKAELAMVCTLIDAIGIDTPTIVDDTAPVVQAYVDAKATSTGAAPLKSVPAPPVMVDLTDMLSASIDAAKAKKKVAA